jgi:hypothetical protein
MVRGWRMVWQPGLRVDDVMVRGVVDRPLSSHTRLTDDRHARDQEGGKTDGRPDAYCGASQGPSAGLRTVPSGKLRNGRALLPALPSLTNHLEPSKAPNRAQVTHNDVSELARFYKYRR